MIINRIKLDEIFKAKKSQLKKFGTQEKIELLNELSKDIENLYPASLTLQNLKDEYNLVSSQKTPGKVVLSSLDGVAVIELVIDQTKIVDYAVKASVKTYPRLSELLQDICTVINEEIDFVSIEYAKAKDLDLSTIKGCVYEEGIKGIASTRRAVIPNQPKTISTGFFKCIKEGLVEGLVATSDCPKDVVEFTPTSNVASSDDYVVFENSQMFIVSEQIIKAITRRKK